MMSTNINGRHLSKWHVAAHIRRIPDLSGRKPAGLPNGHPHERLLSLSGHLSHAPVIGTDTVAQPPAPPLAVVALPTFYLFDRHSDENGSDWRCHKEVSKAKTIARIELNGPGNGRTFDVSAKSFIYN
jgi:hypothetical protein